MRLVGIVLSSLLSLIIIELRFKILDILFNASIRPGAVIEFMLQWAPFKCSEFKGEPLLMSMLIDYGWISGSEKAKLMSSILSSKLKLFSKSKSPEKKVN